jgi:hypothetical protein
MLTESSDGSAQVVFNFTYEGPNKISGIGYTVAGPKLLAMRFVLVKANVD